MTTWSERKAAAAALHHCRFCKKRLNGSGKVAHEKSCEQKHKSLAALDVPIKKEIDWQSRRSVNHHATALKKTLH